MDERVCVHGNGSDGLQLHYQRENSRHQSMEIRPLLCAPGYYSISHPSRWCYFGLRRQSIQYSDIERPPYLHGRYRTPAVICIPLSLFGHTIPTGAEKGACNATYYICIPAPLRFIRCRYPNYSKLLPHSPTTVLSTNGDFLDPHNLQTH
jgi:hypothetical protein